MKSKVIRATTPYLRQEFGEAAAEKVCMQAQNRFSELCGENRQDPAAVKAQTEKNLYPCLALYESLQQAGIEKQKALSFLDRTWSRMSAPKARMMQILAKIPGVCAMMPGIYRKVTLSQFGEAAGFCATFYDLGKKRCKFDMTRCLYCEVCRTYGCPELVPCFCHTDDVTSENIHPRLIWNRTKTMGEGADVCDFDLILKD